MFKRKTVGPIACVVSENRVRLAQLHGSPDRPIAMTTASCDWDDQDLAQGQEALAALAQAITSAMGDGPFVGRDAVLSLPASRMGYRRLRLAPMPDQELAQAVHWRVAKELGVSAREIQSACYDAGQVQDHGRACRDVIAVTAPYVQVDALAQAAMRAGLLPQAIDAAPGMLARAMAMGSRLSAAALLVEVGVDSSALIVVREGRPCFIRTLPGGRRQIIVHAAGRLGLDATRQALCWALLDGQAHPGVDDAMVQVLCEMAMLHAAQLAHEAKLCIHYMAELNGGAHQPTAGCVVGAGAQEDIFLARLGEACELPFHPLGDVLCPGLAGVLGDAVGLGAADSWLPVAGLAMYDLRQALAACQEAVA